jgi:ATP-dependent DNA ligase
MLMAFDCLEFDTADVRPQPLHARQHLLEYVLEEVPPVFLQVRRLADQA